MSNVLVNTGRSVSCYMEIQTLTIRVVTMPQFQTLIQFMFDRGELVECL